METLVKEAKRGDKEAFNKLIIEIEIDLYKIAKMRLNSECDIEEAVQETIIQAYQNIKKLRANNYFKTWIIKILINKCNSIYKKNKKHISIENNILENYYTMEEENSIESNVEFELLIKDLDYKYRIVIILYYLEKYSNKEISQILNIPISTVKNRISRARQKIKKILEGDK